MKEIIILIGTCFMCSCTLSFNSIKAEGNVEEFMDENLKTDAKVDANLHIPSL